MGKTFRISRLKDDTTRIVAKIHGVSERYVRMVRNGERVNEDIMATLIEYQTGKNSLIKELERLVDITPNPKKYARG